MHFETVPSTTAVALPVSRRRWLLAGWILGLIFGGHLLGQTTLYWDLNSTTAGAGVTPTGSWSTSVANWNSVSGGTGSVGNWISGADAVFSAGSDATGSYTVTLTANQNVGNITFEDGNALVTSNTLNLTGASLNPAFGSTIDVATGLTATVNSLLGGSAALIKTGAGTFVTGGSSQNSHTGSVTINAGTFEIQKQGFVGAISNAAAVSVASGATLKLNGDAAYTLETIGSLTGAGTITNTGAAAVTIAVGGTNSSTTFSGVITDTTNNLNLTKQGTGTLTLSGTNSFDGATTVSAGALNVQSNTALGTATTGTSVSLGAALEIQNNITVTAETLSLDGTGVSNGGALRNISGTNTWTGAVSLINNAARINSDSGLLTLSGGITSTNIGVTFGGAGDTTVSSAIGLGSGTVTKDGTGTVTFTTANSYTGATAINAGVLNIRNKTSLGTTASGTTVASGAALEVQNNIAVGTEALNLSGTGVSGNGALRSVSGTNSWGGVVTLAAASEIQTDAGSLTISGAINSANQSLTIDGAGNTTLAGAIGLGSGTLTKLGAGNLTLSSANTYTGSTNIDGGRIIISADNRLGSAPGAATANHLTFDGGTLESTASFTLNANRGVTIDSGGGTFDINSGRTVTYNGIVAGSGTLNKNDVGTFVLGGATTNTHTGDINVNAGTLQIAKTVANAAIGNSAAVTVASGANLTFSGGVSETIGSLGGGGTVNNSNASAITLTTGGNNGSTNFSGVLQDTGGNLSLVKEGSGTMTLSGGTANTFAGTTTINDGVLNLGKTAGVNAVGTGAITIGNGVGAAGSASLTLGASNQIPDTAAVTVNSDGQLSVGTFSETINTIAGTGLLDLGASGNLTIGSGGGSSAFGGTITGSGTLTKVGAGTLTFNNDINFAGQLTLTGGTVALNGIDFTVGTLRISGNTVLDFGSSVASTLSVTNFIVDPGFTLTISNWVDLTDYFFAQNWSGATIGLRGTTPMNQLTFNGYSNNDTAWLNYGPLKQVTPTPEPSTYGLVMMSVAAGVVFWRRRRARALAA